MGLPRIVSLFSGAGGLDLGFHDGGYEIAFAVDRMAAAIKTHQRNFPGTTAVTADITVRDASTGRLLVLDEIAHVLREGEAIGVIGGPPCQGFSRANPRSHADDPRNQMPSFYLEIVEALQQRYDVKFVLFENVMGIRDTKHSATFSAILSKFRDLRLTPGVTEHSALDYGVPQTRNRVIISGFKSEGAAQRFEPERVTGKNLTVRGAIGGLPAPAFYARNLSVEDIPAHPNHWTMRPISKRFTSDAAVTVPTRSFRRLAWEKPSPTVAYGHREIHVHPNGTRRLSIYEAMLLQGFPSTFVLEGTLSQQVEQVSNAVPPPVARSLAAAVTVALGDPEGAVAAKAT
jgi:DNA (cytosine-5)-methyltransferase 1